MFTPLRGSNFAPSPFVNRDPTTLDLSRIVPPVRGSVLGGTAGPLDKSSAPRGRRVVPGGHARQRGAAGDGKRDRDRLVSVILLIVWQSSGFGIVGDQIPTKGQCPC